MWRQSARHLLRPRSCADPRRPSAPPRERRIDDRAHLPQQRARAIVLALGDRDLNGVEQRQHVAPFTVSVGVHICAVLPRAFGDVRKKRLHRSDQSPRECEAVNSHCILVDSLS